MEQEDTKTIEYRLNNIEKSIEELKTYIVETRMQQKDIDFLFKSIEKINGRLETLEKKPAARYEILVSHALTTLVGGLVGYMLFKLGLSINF